MKLLIVVVMLALTNTACATELPAVELAEKRPSPHGVEGSCQVCHVESEDRLNRWSLFSFGVDKKKLSLDFNDVCRQCHGMAFGHGVGKTPRLNRGELPLDKDGKIACAVTCHNMHIQTDDHTQNRYHLRLKNPDLCLSCHDK